MDDLDVTGDASPTSTTGHSGITLVLPSLRALQAANAGKKPKPKQPSELDQRPKNPRPIKLKPLKEVLTKLITQIKKKDDYAFFIRPVNPAQVPGYADVIKNPMDFGTMSVKVARGKYRSLEEFTNDFRLVTANAKTFNPSGSIYHAEADRLEAWGLDHISRASAHVIEYETDWNIDIEQDEDGSTSQQPLNIDDDVSTPRDLDGSLAPGSRAPSMTPAPGQSSTLGQGKRGPRGPYKRHAQTGPSEGLDADGRLPGVKDGVGLFPAGSDWAELMIALKIKGKRYKTKKERLRFEKEGPPYHVDGSLDYAEMEDPFSVLNVFVPEPLTRPQVAPLLLPNSTTMPVPMSTLNSTQSQPRIHAPVPITIPPDRGCPNLSTIPTQHPTVASTSALLTHPPKKRRHWIIARNPPARGRGKDKDGDATADDPKASWKVPRDAGPADYGTFAALLGDLAVSAAGPAGSAAEYMYGSEQRFFATIRSTVEHRGCVKQKDEAEVENAATVWTDERAGEAWDYLRDVVYGGVDGYAYVRSLAEFVAPSVYATKLDQDGDLLLTPPEHHCVTLPFGAPLARYVEDNLVDTVTRGRHGWLRDALVHLAPASTKWDTEPLDLASLVRVPEELARESMLEGGAGDGEDDGEERAQIERALAWSVEVFEELGRRVEKDESRNGGHVRVKEEAVDDARVVEGKDEAEMDVDAEFEPGPQRDADVKEDPDPLVERLRLNLLALAKRAPLERIAKLPVELFPEHIRGSLSGAEERGWKGERRNFVTFIRGV